MKPVIIIAVAVVLFIPISVFAYEHYPQPILNDFTPPPEPTSFEFKGNAHRFFDNYYMAFLNYDKALKQDPDNLTLQNAKDESYNNWKNTGERELYSHSIMFGIPGDWHSFVFFGEYDNAKKSLEESVNDNYPKDGYVYIDTQMKIFYAMGEYEKAAHSFERLDERIKNNISQNKEIRGDTVLFAAMSYEKLGDNSNSEFWYDIADDEFINVECSKTNYFYLLGLFEEIIDVMESNNTFEKCDQAQKYSYVAAKDILSGEYQLSINSVNTPTYSTPSEKSESICGTGTVEKNGQCVPERKTMTTEMQQKSSKGGGCLIATATFGSEMAPQVQQLRELRDNSLLNTESGSFFMNSFNSFYYSFSPYIADYERENPVFKEAVRLAITPMISSLSILNYVDMDSEAEVLGYGISLIILNIVMYVGIPVVAIMKIRK